MLVTALSLGYYVLFFTAEKSKSAKRVFYKHQYHLKGRGNKIINNTKPVKGSYSGLKHHRYG